MRITFWGVRGSRPTPGKHTLKYGGNTPCIELGTPNDHLIILDSGYGICSLGDELMGETSFKDGKEKIHMLITHNHPDHIQGFPFFGPAYVAGNEFTMYGKPTLEEALRRQMENERVGHFPVNLDYLNATMTFKEIGPNEDIELGQKFDLPDNFTAIAYPLKHPQGCLGYRIEGPDKKVIAYVTDVELGADKESDENAHKLAKGADLLIVDAQYTPEDYIKDWGHSTWVKAVELGKEAEAKKIVLFHHDPKRTDKQLTRIVKEAKKEFENTSAARERKTIYL